MDQHQQAQLTQLAQGMDVNSESQLGMGMDMNSLLSQLAQLAQLPGISVDQLAQLSNQLGLGQGMFPQLTQMTPAGFGVVDGFPVDGGVYMYPKGGGLGGSGNTMDDYGEVIRTDQDKWERDRLRQAPVDNYSMTVVTGNTTWTDGVIDNAALPGVVAGNGGGNYRPAVSELTVAMPDPNLPNYPAHVSVHYDVPSMPDRTIWNP
jgi:hypothetical protein